MKHPIVRIETVGIDAFRVYRKRRILPGWKVIGGTVPAISVFVMLRLALPTYSAACEAYEKFLDEIGGVAQLTLKEFSD